jgi:hypothetical protein
MILILVWGGAIGGLLLGLLDLLAKAGAGFGAPPWVLPAAVVCLAGYAIGTLISHR